MLCIILIVRDVCFQETVTSQKRTLTISWGESKLETNDKPKKVPFWEIFIFIPLLVTN
jgi:hypothetical protein